jgi:hypothetical protein
LVVLVGVLAACGGDDGMIIDVTCRPVPVYLNRTGGMFEMGPRDDAVLNVSTIVDGPRVMAPWPNPNWDELVACVRSGLMPFPRLEVTETDPLDVPHREIVFTDAYWNGAATTMIVPGACREHQIEIVFGDAVATNARACHVALQGFAQMTAQLSLNDNCYDLVNNFQDCTPQRTFVDQMSNCVDATNQPAPCRCGGMSTENTFRALAATFPTCD